jgi:NADH-quinone oxidoreductase subunit N
VSRADLLALSPLAAVAVAAVAAALVAAFRRSHAATAGVTVAGLALGLVLLATTAAGAPRQVTPLFLVDGYGRLITGLMLGATLVVALLAWEYLRGREAAPEEFYPLLLLAALGGGVLACASHLAGLFLGVELLSVPLYVLIAYPRDRAPALEAGLKYLVLAGASSGFLLFGMALIYAETGVMDFATLPGRLPAAWSPVLRAGVALLLAGLGFKLAAVPFHMWTPDVYQGAPAPVSAFLATVSKGAVAAALPRLWSVLGVTPESSLWTVLALVAVASMVAGNLLALLQDNVKRLLAYSSIAHVGYLLVALLAGGGRAVEAVSFYLVAYVVTMLTAFGVVGALSGAEGEAERLDEYRGLLWRHPWVAAAFTAALFSLAGIPLTAGFIGKFYVFAAGAASASWLLALTVALTSTVGLFYYLRIIVAMLSQGAGAVPDPAGLRALSPGIGWVLALLCLLLLGLGAYPFPLMRLLQGA